MKPATLRDTAQPYTVMCTWHAYNAAVSWITVHGHLMAKPACSICAEDHRVRGTAQTPISKPPPAADGVAQREDMARIRDRAARLLARKAPRLTWSPLAESEFGTFEFVVVAWHDAHHRRLAEFSVDVAGLRHTRGAAMPADLIAKVQAEVDAYWAERTAEPAPRCSRLRGCECPSCEHAAGYGDHLRDQQKDAR